MPEIQPAASAAAFIFFDDGGDEDWGDFVATSTPTSSSPLFNPFPDPVTTSPESGGSTWEKPRGALPLSIFGDEEVEDPVPVAGSDPLFASPSPRSDVIKSGSGGDLKDLIANLYGQPMVTSGSNGSGPDSSQGDEDLDWEFQRAVSTDAGVKIEKGGDILDFGFEKKEVGDDNGAGVVNRFWQSEDVTNQPRVGNVERDSSDVYVTHYGFTNGFDFGSVVSNGHHTLETNQQTELINNVNGSQSSFENGIEDDNFWKFKDAYSELEDLSIPFGNQKIPNAKAEIVMKISETQNARSIWETDMHKLPNSYNIKSKIDSGGPSEDHNWPASEATMVDHYKDVSLNNIVAHLYDKADQDYNGDFTQKPTKHGPKLPEIGPHSVGENDDDDFDEVDWEFQKASLETTEHQYSVVKLDQSVHTESTQNIYLDIYCRLQEECFFLVVYHLDDLKKARDVAALSGERAKLTELDEKIQAASNKLPEAKISETDFIGKHPSKDVCVSRLQDIIKEPHFSALEQEYCLQERIISASINLHAAVEIYEHTIPVLQILGLACVEEQQAYISVWSKMAMACAQELKHGAMVWEESVRADVSTQILSQGNQYFVALAEIYRVSEILRASLKLYKPWLLSSVGDSNEVLMTSLEKCAEVWKAHGLEKALEKISITTDLEHAGRAKSLLESIKIICKLDDLSLRLHAFGHKKTTICRLSLLPMEVLQGMEIAVWNGEHYCLKLGNMWANRISCDPPKLPHIHVG